MTFVDFISLIEARPNGVVLLEGRRAIPEDDARRATELAIHLATELRSLRFRSGNAQGADHAFSKGVARVDAGRLQVIAPYATHRKGSRHEGAVYDSPESLTRFQQDDVAYKTAEATPSNRGLIEQRSRKGPLGAKAAYLIRDTMKVTGYSADFQKPICALFYVDPREPMAGGTGHTIRVCQSEGVPYAFQDSWRAWAP